MDILKRLKLLEEEDIIWIIYIFLAIAALISNYYEKRFIYTNNLNFQKNFKTINITIFVITFFIYLYFVLIKYDNIKNFKIDTTKKDVISSYISFIASLLFLIGGILFLLSEINKDNPPTDIGLI